MSSLGDSAVLVMLASGGEESSAAQAAALRQSGCDVATAASIEDVMRQVETMPDLPHVIVLDLPLRRSIDVDALGRLRTNRYTASIPLVFIAGSDGAAPPAAVPFDAVLRKPAGPTELVDAVHLLSRRTKP